MAFKLDYMKDELVEMYQSGKSFYQIAKEIGEYEQAVSNVIRSVIHVPKRKPYSINEEYFKHINTVDKAYFFGLIAADGAIVRNSNNHLTMTISLKSEDGYILEKLREATEAEVTIKEYKQSYQKEGGEYSYQKRFVTANEKFVKHLMTHGVSERKSNTLGDVLKNVDREYQIDFIRGFFDGNGSIYKTVTSGTQERHYCSFRGTKEILTSIKEYLPFEGGTIYWGKGTDTDTGQYGWKFGAKKDIETFRDLIYHENIEDYYMIRKYNKFPW